MTPTLRPLHDGLQLLADVSDSSESLGVSAIATRCGWPKSRAHRILTALVATGYVEQDAQRRYRATAKVLRLASGVMSHHPLRLLALPIMRRLCEETDCEATLSVLHEQRSLAIAVDSPSGKPTKDQFARLGQSSYLHGAANGKVLLAWLPLIEQQHLLKQLVLPRLTARTITDHAQLSLELENVRLRGYAKNDRENQPQVVTVSVPVYDGFHHCQAALGLSRTPGCSGEATLIKLLKREAAELTKLIAGIS